MVITYKLCVKDSHSPYLIPSLYPSNPLWIQNVNLTQRQLDVLSAFVHTKKPQSVATLLGISNKGVEAHLYNLKKKFFLERKALQCLLDICSSQEKSTLTKHYQYLLVEKAFQNTCAFIYAQNQKKIIPYEWKQSYHNLPLAHISKHLALAGLKFVPHEQKISLDLSVFHQPQDYYQCLIEVFKTVFVSKAFQSLCQDFLEQQKNIFSDHEKRDEVFPGKGFLLSSPYTYLWLLGVFLSVLWITIPALENKTPFNIHPIRSETLNRIPKDNLLLKRPQLWNQMLEHLQSTHKSLLLPCVVITGVEGSGKTTLARTYGFLEKNTDVVWEFNASSQETLSNDFEDLAHKLAQTKELQEELLLLQHIFDKKRQQKSLLDFVQRHIRPLKSWIFIYDNVLDLSAVMDFVAMDALSWGQGKIIITTRNKQTCQTHFMSSQNIMDMDALSPDESLSLLSQMIYERPSVDLSSQLQNKARRLLKKIPPFPLDVLTECKYMKKAHLSLTHYLKRRHTNASNPCASVRYPITADTITQLLALNPSYKDLLGLIRMLPAEPIPRSWFERLYPSEVVDQFIRDIHDTALIVLKNPYNTLHIHPCIHELMGIILGNLLKTNPIDLPKICKALVDEINDARAHHDGSRYHQLFIHIPVFLRHLKTQAPHLTPPLRHLMGKLWGSTGHKEKGRTYIAQAFTEYQNQGDFQGMMDAKESLISVYLNTGDYERVQKESEHVFKTYAHFLSKQPALQGRFLARTGLSLMYRGNYPKAREYFHQAAPLLAHTDQEWSSLVDKWLGDLERMCEHYDLSRKHYDRALKSYSPTSTHGRRILAMKALMDIQEGKTTKMHPLKASYQQYVSSPIHNPLSIAQASLDLAEARIILHEGIKALPSLETAEKFLQIVLEPHHPHRMQPLLLKAKYALQNGDLKKLKAYLCLMKPLVKMSSWNLYKDEYYLLKAEYEYRKNNQKHILLSCLPSCIQKFWYPQPTRSKRHQKYLRKAWKLSIQMYGKNAVRTKRIQNDLLFPEKMSRRS